MTHRDFLNRLAAVAGLAALLAAGLRLSLGPHWFSLYGWATVALAATPLVTWLLWKRLPQVGQSRWLSVALGLPVFIAAVVQVAFWLAFFAQGPKNPLLGVVREMLRPWLEKGEPFALVAVLTLASWLVLRAARSAP